MSTPTGVVAIANGYDFYLALKNDGTVWAWNDNTFGQLGNGTNTSSATPVAVSNLTGVTAIAAGNDFALALKSDGTVWSWGSNFFGSLGNGSSIHSNTPVQVVGLTGVTTIAAGGFHGLAITSDHRVWSWGWNGWGQLGDGTNTDSNTPHVISSLTGVTAIGAGFYHSLALKSDGTVWAFGQNAFGQLGNTTNVDSNIPVAVYGLQSVGAIATRWLHSVALPPLPPVTMTINSAPSGLTFTVTGSGCATGSYSTPATLNWPPTGLCNVQFSTPQPEVKDPLAPPVPTRYVFTGWSDGAPLGSSRNFATPFANTSITANFKTQYLLSTSVSPSATGSVLGSGYYDAGSTASILATSNAGYQFGSWTGPAASASNASTTVSMNTPQSVTANFLLITTTTAGTASGQYSDSVTLSATVGAAVNGFSGTLQFQVAGVNVGPPLTVNGAGTYTTNYTIDKGVGTYPIFATFSSVVAAGSFGTNTLTVSAEDASITPAASNPQSFQVSVAGGMASLFALTGTIQEAFDASPGDISKAVVTVTLVPALAGGANIDCPVVNSAGSLTATCSNVPVSAYTVQWRATGSFYQAPAVDTPLAVYDPSLGFITGSGSVKDNGVQADFTFSVKYVNKAGLTGSITYTEHRLTGDVTISTNSLTAMALTGNTAVVNAQATVNGSGNYPVQMTITDNGNPGVNHDLFGLTVTGSPLNPPIAFVPAAITAGNIITH
jgi:hypothetical protein